jgi:hypothetical protein
MAEYLSPGVYIEEVDSGPRPIEGVGTAMAAFVGFAPAGPVNQPVLVTNWSQYVETFGAAENGGRVSPHMKGSYLSHAVYGYFLNGGGRCYVTRLGANGASGSVKATLQLPSKGSKALASLILQPKDNVSGDIEIEVAPPSGETPPEGTFTLRIKMKGVQETFENVSHGKGKNTRNVVETINAESQLVTVVEAQATGALAERVPETGSYTLKTSQPATLPATVQSTTFKGDVTARSGIDGLEVAEDVTMLCCPDLMAAYEAGMIDKDGVKAVQVSMIALVTATDQKMARAGNQLRFAVCCVVLPVDQGRRAGREIDADSSERPRRRYLRTKRQRTRRAQGAGQ